MSGETHSVVLYDASDGIARITLNRPDKRNALNDELIAALKDALRRANNDSQVRVVILSGSGSDFCSGADLAALQKISSFTVAENLRDAQSLMELFLLIRTVNPPVVAAVRGRALAGGCGLALACDIVLAARSSRFGFPEVKIGFVPAMVMSILRRSASEKKAFELITTGDEIGAEEAAPLGLINHVIDDAAFDDEVNAFVQRFKRTSRSAVSLSKGLFYKIDSLAFAEALGAGADINAIARMTEDCQKGIARFLRKE
ncbi:MAG: methylglutaconyl-CoA hydratase [Acidobacteria bacterium]|nr:MAG: methylglutaconyl-CoA hydratase [Acidobacteriota bacterium]